MFGLLVPSRPVQPQPHDTPEPTKFAFTIPPAPAFSHLAVFLLPGHVLPPDVLAGIYIKIPPAGRQGEGDFRLLGALAGDKQSAVFRIGGAAASASSSEGVREEIMLDDATGAPVGSGGADILVGISVEPAAQIQAQLDALRAQSQPASSAQGQLVKSQSAAPTAEMLKEAARRIGLHAFNFLSGFASGPPGAEVVPLKSVQEWWAKFEKKVGMDVGFLMREGG